MAKPAFTDSEATDKADGDGAPVIDLNEASLKRLIAKAKKRGWITYDELNAALPQDQRPRVHAGGDLPAQFAEALAHLVVEV